MPSYTVCILIAAIICPLPWTYRLISWLRYLSKDTKGYIIWMTIQHYVIISFILQSLNAMIHLYILLLFICDWTSGREWIVCLSLLHMAFESWCVLWIDSCLSNFVTSEKNLYVKLLLLLCVGFFRNLLQLAKAMPLRQMLDRST